MSSLANCVHHIWAKCFECKHVIYGWAIINDVAMYFDLDSLMLSKSLKIELNI